MPLGLLERLDCVSLYVPNLEQAIVWYSRLGLRAVTGEVSPSSGEAVHSVRMYFPDGGSNLLLHDDPKRQFSELMVRVRDVGETYRELSRRPELVWLETPDGSAPPQQAVVRLPDGNLLTLVGREDIESARATVLPGEALTRTAGDD